MAAPPVLNLWLPPLCSQCFCIESRCALPCGTTYSSTIATVALRNARLCMAVTSIHTTAPYVLASAYAEQNRHALPYD